MRKISLPRSIGFPIGICLTAWMTGLVLLAQLAQPTAKLAADKQYFKAYCKVQASPSDCPNGYPCPLTATIYCDTFAYHLRCADSDFDEDVCTVPTVYFRSCGIKYLCDNTYNGECGTVDICY